MIKNTDFESKMYIQQKGRKDGRKPQMELKLHRGLKKIDICKFIKIGKKY
jgi:hypothetical protein